MDDPEALAERTSHAINGRSPSPFVDLFDLPAVVYAADHVDIRRRPDDLRAAHRRLRELLRTYGSPSYGSAPVAVRPLGERLIVVRRETYLRFPDGALTDPNQELWALREDERGRLRIVLAVNSLAGWLRPATLAEPAPPEPGAPGDAASLASEMERSFNRRDVATHYRQLDTPFIRVGDAGAEIFDDPASGPDLCGSFFTKVDAAGIREVSMIPRAHRYFGAGLEAARVEILATYEDGHTADPYTEVWVMREVRGALRVAAIVNPLERRLVDPSFPLRRQP